MLSALLPALFHHQILNPAKYLLRWWKTCRRTSWETLPECTGRCFPRINLFSDFLELLPNLVHMSIFSRDKWMPPVSHIRKTNGHKRIWKWTEPLSRYRWVFLLFFILPVKVSQNYYYKSLVSLFSPCPLHITILHT